jgi:hypothetical protein
MACLAPPQSEPGLGRRGHSLSIWAYNSSGVLLVALLAEASTTKQAATIARRLLVTHAIDATSTSMFHARAAIDQRVNADAGAAAETLTLREEKFSVGWQGGMESSPAARDFRTRRRVNGRS